METETLTSPDVEEAAMRELGVETDAAAGREPEAPQDAGLERSVDPDTAPQPDAPAPESPEPTQPEVHEPQRDHPQQRPRDPVTGKFEKPDTDYSRAQKEQARKDRSWQALQAEKEQFRMAQTQWEEQQRMAQLEATRQNYQPLKKEGLTAQEYAEGARRFEAEGDFENAYKAHQVALQLQQAEHQRGEQMRGVEAEYSWRKGMEEVSKAYPGIWNPNDPIVPHLERIIAQNPWIYYVPQGFQRAAEVAHMLTQMGTLKEQQDENIKLRAELEKYQRKGQPARGGYAAPRTREKDFDEMGLDEQEAHLKHLTAEADSWR
jgi:hypothetical protein